MVRLIVIGLLLATGFGSGWMVNGWRWEAKEVAKLRDLAQTQARADKRSYDASEGFEKDKENVRTVFKEIRVEVDKIIERPGYRNVCFDDDGLLQLERAIEETAR